MTSSTRGELLGFIVQELPDDVSTVDIIHQGHTVYPTWDAAIRAASLLANGLAEKYNSNITCILRSSSRNTCLENGYVISHRLIDWRCDIVIFPVFAAASSTQKLKSIKDV
jgi:hypothetical protein